MSISSNLFSYNVFIYRNSKYEYGKKVVHLCCQEVRRQNLHVLEKNSMYDLIPSNIGFLKNH